MKQSVRQWLKPVAVVFLLVVGPAGCSREEVPADLQIPETGAMPPAGSMPQTGATSPGAAIYGVNVDVSYTGDPSMLGDAARVYVFLRKPGTRMPLAVQHFAGNELPKTVSFAGSTPEEAVELVVRLSPSGRVDRSPDDIEFIRPLPGLLHPPQTVSAALGAADAATVADAGGDGQAPAAAPAAAPVAIRTAIRIREDHPFAPDSVVFLIAKRPGQPMPAAVKRLSVGELPAEVELTDADAMTFGSRLSDAGSLELIARVSLSGTAARSDADWVSDTVRLQTNRLPDEVPLTIHPPGGA